MRLGIGCSPHKCTYLDEFDIEMISNNLFLTMWNLICIKVLGCLDLLADF